MNPPDWRDWDDWAKARLYWKLLTRSRPEQIPSSDSDWLIWFLKGGRGSGKALALDTPLPTPTGWTTMGDVQVGDQLLDEQGKPCNVTFTTPIQLHRPCFEIVFSDGSVLIADAEHRWMTWTHAARKSYGRMKNPQTHPQVRTTTEILDTLTYGNRPNLNHSIQLTQPLDLPDTNLPIPPYTLGAWLGDGTSRGAEITTMDQEILDYIRGEGFNPQFSRTAGGKASTYSLDKREALYDGRFVPRGGLHSVLRAENLLDNKHIPSFYFRSSIQQRRLLLAGLLDTDGYAGKGGMVEFCTTKEVLAEGVYELIVSLGMRCTWKKGVAKLYGVEIGPKWRVHFRPTMPVFGLSRKAERISRPDNQQRRHTHRMIVDVRPVSSVPVRCLTVDSSSSLFLAGRSMIPTHNTRAGAEDISNYCRQNPHSRVALIGPTFADIRDTMVEGESGLLSILPSSALLGHSIDSAWNRSIGELFLSNGCILRAFSSEKPGRLRGPQHHRIWCEEPAEWADAHLHPIPKSPNEDRTWANAMFGLRLGPHPRAIVTGTPKNYLLIRYLMGKLEEKPPKVLMVEADTYRNMSNLSPMYKAIIASYEGTRLGLQELLGQLLENIEGALWTWEQIENDRVSSAPDLLRVEVGVDPAASNNPDSDETGIIVGGVAANGHGYTLADYSIRGSADERGREIKKAYDNFGADRVVAEVNNGGDMVEHLINTIDPTIPVKKVHASRGKQTRADPIAALSEQHRIHHVGPLPHLEAQLTSWEPLNPRSKSPDRLDAYVWLWWDLMVDGASKPAYGGADGLASTRMPGVG